MRALILLESLVVIGLAMAILLVGRAETGPRPGDVFEAWKFLPDASPGERAEYAGDDGTRWEFRIGDVVGQGGQDTTPWKPIRLKVRDASGTVTEDLGEYHHRPHVHGLFPFLTPAQPTAYDRVWVLRRLRRETLVFQGRELECWHADCLDPGLPADRDAVEVWMHEDVPVFGVLQWSRGGRTYRCTSWKPPS